MPQSIPKSDAGTLAYLRALSQNLSDRPAAYATSPADADNLAGLVGAYQAAYDAATNENTRTVGSILRKSQAKSDAVRFARALVDLIKPNMGVGDENKRVAGIPLPRTGGGTPVPPPSSAPALMIVGSVTGSMTLTYRDSFDPGRKGKPYGVRALMLYRSVSGGEGAEGGAPVGPTFYKAYTRGPIGVAFEPEDNGKLATFYACWATARMEEGPMSTPVSMTIAA